MTEHNISDFVLGLCVGYLVGFALALASGLRVLVLAVARWVFHRA